MPLFIPGISCPMAKETEYLQVRAHGPDFWNPEPLDQARARCRPSTIGGQKLRGNKQQLRLTLGRFFERPCLRVGLTSPPALTKLDASFNEIGFFAGFLVASPVDLLATITGNGRDIFVHGSSNFSSSQKITRRELASCRAVVGNRRLESWPRIEGFEVVPALQIIVLCRCS